MFATTLPLAGVQDGPVRVLPEKLLHYRRYVLWLRRSSCCALSGLSTWCSAVYHREGNIFQNRFVYTDLEHSGERDRPIPFV